MLCRHARHGLMPLGKFSLNLINPSIGKVSGILQGIVQNLLPKVCTIYIVHFDIITYVLMM